VTGEPPGQVCYTLDEALDLLADLEDARDAFSTRATSPSWWGRRTRSACSAVNSASRIPREAPMSAEPLRATEAARRLGISTRDLLRLIHEREIGYVMVDGIAHVPVEAIEEYRARAS
jgi:excisionase family DNA binding protein